MPGLNRTGPEGQGSRTGRGLGKCNPGTNEETKNMNQGESESDQVSRMGLGRRLGRGIGRGAGAGRRGGMGRGRNQGRGFGRQ